MDNPRTLKRIVPWIDRKEWLDVYKSTFCEDPEKWKFAIDRLLIWKIRSCENLALALELTWQLLSLKLIDIENERVAFLDESTMRDLYGLYILRFVNYTLEYFQNGNALIPLKLLTQKIGMPQEMLDLRHLITYDTPPELDCLRNAVNEALDILKCNYWLPQIQYVFTDGHECHTRFNLLLHEYLQLKNIKASEQMFKYKMLEMEPYVQANCEEFLQFLSGYNSLMFPSQGQKTDDMMKVPRHLAEEWTVLFHQLIKWNLMEQFLEKLLKKISRVGTEQDRCILAWTCFICRDENQMKQVKATKFNFDAIKILHLAMGGPNRFTPFFINKFCGLFSETFKHRNEMLSLLKAIGINHPWQDACLDFASLENKGHQNVKNSEDYRKTNVVEFDREHAIIKMERVEFQKILCKKESNELKTRPTGSHFKRKNLECTVDVSDLEEEKHRVMSDWKFRCYDHLSIASELTRQLLKLKSIDAKNRNLNFLTEYQMGLLYGMNIMRFVERTLKLFKSVRGTPLEQIARKAGLSKWIVDLRHEVAHQGLPEVFILRDAAEEALKFLKINYWIPQSLYGTRGDDNDAPSFDEFFKLVKQVDKYEKLSADENLKLQEMELYIQANCKELIETLMKDKSLLFLPGNTDDVLEIPTDSIKQWSPMFDQLIDWNLIHGLLDKMLRSLTEIGSDHDMSVLAWTCHICQEGRQRRQRIASKLNFEAKKILFLGTIKQNKFTPFFVNKLCALFPEISKYRSHLLNVSQICGYTHPWQESNVDLKTLLDNIGHKTMYINDSNHLDTATIIERILFDEKDTIGWFKYPLGVNPRSYFGSVFILNEETTDTNINKDDSMDLTFEEDQIIDQIDS